MKRIIVIIGVILFWSLSSPAGAVNDLVDPEFKRALQEHGYPPKVYKAEEMIEREMRERGTCLEAFEASIGKKPDGHLDRRTFLQWQERKEFKPRADYRQHHPWVEYEWGERKIRYPARVKPEDVQIVLPLEPPTNKILVAWDTRELTTRESGWRIIYGYENSSQLHKKKTVPLHTPPGYYGAILPAPPGKAIHFRLVKQGVNTREFPGRLPFKITYRELAEEGMIPKEVWHEYHGKKCQAVIKNGDRIRFLRPQK